MKSFLRFFFKLKPKCLLPERRHESFRFVFTTGSAGPGIEPQQRLSDKIENDKNCTKIKFTHLNLLQLELYVKFVKVRNKFLNNDLPIQIFLSEIALQDRPNDCGSRKEFYDDCLFLDSERQQ